MAGLYFRHGTMNASKTANLIMIGHNYEEQGFKVLYLKPAIDIREDENISDTITIRSRIGISKIAKPVFEQDKNIIKEYAKGYDVVMVDESQFLSEEQVDILEEISLNIVVMCFGLITDFRRKLFPGSKRLLEIADSIQEIKSVCKCGKRATINARFNNGKIVTKGEQILIGGNDTYRGICKHCYIELLNESVNHPDLRLTP